MPDPVAAMETRQSAVRAPGKDGAPRTVLVAFVVALSCSLLVTAAAVLLRPRVELNQEMSRQRNVLEAAGLPTDANLAMSFSQIETRIVDLETGRYIDPDVIGLSVDQIEAATMDPRRVARDPALVVDIPAELDTGNISQRTRYSVVYLLHDNAGQLRSVVLPVYGHGLWSTMYGYLAIEPDMNTIVGLRFHKHGETPGLGGEIDSPVWLAAWPGKRIHGPSGQVAIEVLKGHVRAGAKAANQVDGISGATLTGNGVTHLLRYWLSDHAFGPYLRRLRESSEGSP